MFNVNAFFGYLVNHYLLLGVLMTLGLTIFPMVAGLIFGTLVAVARTSSWQILSLLSKFYVWVFRGTPLLVSLVIIYTGLPQIGIKFGVTTSVLLAFTLNEAAFLSEVIRAGLLGVPQGQRDAAAALGLSWWQTLSLVVLPQALRIIVPPIGNSVNGLLKATSLASVISMEELMRRAQVLMQVKFEVLELYLVTAVWYLVLTTLWDFVQAPLERRLARGFVPETSGPKIERF